MTAFFLNIARRFLDSLGFLSFSNGGGGFYPRKGLAMAEIYIWAAASGFALVGYTMSKRLGLLDEVPRDPKARVAAYSSSALGALKEQLIGSELQSWEPSKISYLKNGTPGNFWVENGALHCKSSRGEESHPIGDLGTLSFSYIDEELLVTILAAETDGAEHSSQVTLRMRQNSPSTS